MFQKTEGYPDHHEIFSWFNRYDHNRMQKLLWLLQLRHTDIFYGLPKVHKPDFKNVNKSTLYAAYNSHSFKISKNFTNNLSPSQTNKCTVGKSQQFPFLLPVRKTLTLVMRSRSIQITSSVSSNVPLSESTRCFWKKKGTRINAD